MAPLGFIEILDAKGTVAERVQVDAWPIAIGRAYSNQVIVDDAYVCPRHVAIEPDEQGRLLARDLGSINGLYPNANGTRVEKLEIISGTQFRIGHTFLRFCSVDHPPAVTVIDSPTHYARWAPGYIGAVALLLVLIALCVDGFLSSVERVKFIDIIGSPLVTIASMLIWAGSWALASRIMLSHFHFNQHVTIACAAILGFLLLSALAEWAQFLMPSIQVGWFATVFGSGSIFAAIVYGHLGFASPLRRRSRLWAALMVSLAVVGMNVISDFAARSKFSTVMDYNGVLKPLDGALVPATSIDQFFSGSEKIKAALENLAQKAKANQP